MGSNGIANAATRSALNGSSFGDNFRAAIPDIIGGAIGNAIAGGVGGALTVRDSRHSSAIVITPDELAQETAKSGNVKVAQLGSVNKRPEEDTRTVVEKFFDYLLPIDLVDFSEPAARLKNHSDRALQQRVELNLSDDVGDKIFLGVNGPKLQEIQAAGGIGAISLTQAEIHIDGTANIAAELVGGKIIGAAISSVLRSAKGFFSRAFSVIDDIPLGSRLPTHGSGAAVTPSAGLPSGFERRVIGGEIKVFRTSEAPILTTNLKNALFSALSKSERGLQRFAERANNFVRSRAGRDAAGRDGAIKNTIGNGLKRLTVNNSIPQTLTRDENLRVGLEFVGDNARQTTSRGVTAFVSADGNRVFTLPTRKRSFFASTGFQSNLETFTTVTLPNGTSRRVVGSNVHINVDIPE